MELFSYIIQILVLIDIFNKSASCIIDQTTHIYDPRQLRQDK